MINIYCKIPNLKNVLKHMMKVILITDEEWDNKYFELQELEKETGLDFI